MTEFYDFLCKPCNDGLGITNKTVGADLECAGRCGKVDAATRLAADVWGQHDTWHIVMIPALAKHCAEAIRKGEQEE